MSTDVSSATKFFPQAQDGFTTTTSGSISSAATTVPLNSTGNYTNGDTVVMIIEPGVTGKEQTFTGVIDVSGVRVTGVVWTKGVNTAHSSGVTVVDYVTATHFDLMSKGMAVEHAQTGVHNAAAGVTIGKMLYPVGSLYFNGTDGTNPSSLLGFGTWVAFGGGRVPVGVGTSDAVYAAGATGGESTHILTSAEMPSHTHTINYGTGTAGSGSGNFPAVRVDSTSTSFDTTVTGADGAHNNLQPYIVVYIWRRTA